MTSTSFPTLVSNLPKEHAYYCEVEGSIPADLRGILYRNGPGIFERNGKRKENLLDGDGMIRSFQFDDKGVFFRNKFVKTEKFVEEDHLGAFKYATWSTKAPGGFRKNLFGNTMKNQAGVTVLYRGNRLFAFDDAFTPYELDPDTLDSKGLAECFYYSKNEINSYGAHHKYDPVNKEWIHFGFNYKGTRIKANIMVFNEQNKLKRLETYKLPFDRFVFVHDFFLTQKYIVFNLHPCYLNLFPFLLGLKSMAEVFKWKAEKGNILMVIDRNFDKPAKFIPCDARYMFHSINAFDSGSSEIIADFVGFDAPTFVGDQKGDTEIEKIMKGEHVNLISASCPPRARRYIINVETGFIKEECLSESNLAMPVIHPLQSTNKHGFAYFGTSNAEAIFFNGISRFNTKNQKLNSFYLEENQNCFEPTFVPKTQNQELEKRKQGYLLAEVNDESTGLSELLVLNAEQLEDGPIAKVKLKHHLPFSFHGFWRAFYTT